jgi:hypothetical protein
MHIRWKFWGICVAICLIGMELQARTIIVFAGIPRGGSGDIAANLIMARHLKKLSPADHIIFAVDETAKMQEGDHEDVLKILKRLIPQWDSQKIQMINGIEVRLVNLHPFSGPRADYALGFSLRVSDGIPEWFMKSGRFAFIFEEPSNRHRNYSIFEGTEEWEPGRRYNYSPSVVMPGYAGSSHIILETGARTRGIYALPRPPQPPLSRPALLKKLLPYIEMGPIKKWRVAFQLDANPLEGSWLGLAYSFYGGPTQRYINVMKNVANDLRYRGSPINIFVRKFNDLSIDHLPPNLAVHPYTSMPFEVHESLMAHADLPIQVTGNVSTSQAAQYEKFYFPDNAAPGNVTGGHMAFYEKMVELDPYFGNSEFRPFFRMDGVVSSENMSSADQLRFGPSEELLTRLSLDPEYENRFIAAQRNLIAEASLPLNVLRMIRMLDQFPSNGTRDDQLRIAQALDAVSGVGDTTKFSKELDQVNVFCQKALQNIRPIP